MSPSIYDLGIDKLSRQDRLRLVDEILDTHRFDFDAASAAPAWLAELRGEHVPETEALGIRSFVYRRRVPFHPQRLWDLMHTEWLREHGRVLRSKGYFWLASRMDTAGSWGQAGGVMRHGGAGAWWAAVDEAEWPDEEEARGSGVDVESRHPERMVVVPERGLPLVVRVLEHGEARTPRGAEPIGGLRGEEVVPRALGRVVGGDAPAGGEVPGLGVPVALVADAGRAVHVGDDRHGPGVLIRRRARERGPGVA